ncbi:hypothetical protein B0T18DRAFT_421177 [Schizothecium vesticola]|uniref:Uncharacterized protein n=1 Tax=Schizothecium vesticola TaxID=314040 RepID=A0AA40BPS5_9PEZI|nr:hypothetical protein B0T18DRAFT_421177 [Schizothecium vesticola]
MFLLLSWAVCHETTVRGWDRELPGRHVPPFLVWNWDVPASTSMEENQGTLNINFQWLREVNDVGRTGRLQLTSQKLFTVLTVLAV